MDLLRYKYLPLNHSLTLKIRRYPNNTQTCGKLRIEQISINCCVYAVNIDVVADISCDIDGPIACTIRPSTIDDPIYGFHKSNSIECDFLDPDAIAVMAVDNLPCELPRDSSEMFGEMFLKYVIPSFFNDDIDDILKNSQMTLNGKLTPRFEYLSDYVV